MRRRTAPAAASMLKFIFLILIGGAIAFSYYFVVQSTVWQGYYYPEGCPNCEGAEYISSPTFRSKDECTGWGRELAARARNLDDRFQCKKNCKQRGSLTVCDEIVDCILVGNELRCQRLPGS